MASTATSSGSRSTPATRSRRRSSNGWSGPRTCSSRTTGPGRSTAMGLGPARLRELNPRLVVTSLSGFGQTGPMAGRALFDPIAQAMSGLMSLTGDPDGPPMLTGTYIADHLAGLYGAIGTLLALHARERTGEGQLVDVASLDALFSCLGTRPLEVAMLGLTPRRHGSRDAFSAPANVFRASDGYLYIHGGTDAAVPAPVRGDRTARPGGRHHGFGDVPAGWRRSTSSRPRSRPGRRAGPSRRPPGRWPLPGSRSGRSRRSRTPWRPPRSPRARCSSRSSIPRWGLLVTGLPVKLSATPGAVRKAPPMVGEDNDRDLSRSARPGRREIAELRASGAI